MTSYDAAMAGVIVAGMVWGAFKGVTWQLAGILSLVLGYSVAQPLSTQIAPHFPGEPVVARALAMIAVYFAVSGGVFVAAWLIRATLKKLQFESFDRHLGMVLGGVEGALLGLVVTLFVVSLSPATRGPIFESPTGKVVGALMAAVGPVLPTEARRVLRPFLEDTHEEVASAPAIAEDIEPDLEPEPDPEPLPPRTAMAPKRRARNAPAAVPGPTPPPSAARDDEASPASFRDFLEQSQRRIGRAVIEGATEGLRKAAEGEAPKNEKPRAPDRR